MTYGSLKASDGTGEAVLAHVTADRLVGSTTLLVDSTENWPANFIAVTGTLNSEGFIETASMTQLRGHLDAGNIAIDSFEPGYADIGNVEDQVVIIKMTTEWANDVARLALVSHNDDGTIKDNAVGLAQQDDEVRKGWWHLGVAPTSISNLGGGLYSLVFAGNHTSKLSKGMRAKGQRTVTAPTVMLDLDGVSKYARKTSSITGLSFTDDFSLGTNGILNAYPTALAAFGSRINTATGGFILGVDTNGQAFIQGQNGVNFRRYNSVRTLPLGKPFHLVATLDLSANTAQFFINGEDAGSYLALSSGTPTSIVQAGNLDIGAYNSVSAATGFVNAKISQFSIHSVKLTLAQAKAMMDQVLSGAEPSIVSGYNFNNALTDVTGANTLTAVNSAGYTTESVFAGGSSSYFADGKTELGTIYSKPSYAGSDTTVQILAAPGYRFPTSGGMGQFDFATDDAPYGYPMPARQPYYDANGWLVTEFEGYKRATRIGTFSGGSRIAGATWVLGNISLPVGVGVQGNLKSKNYSVLMASNGYALGYNLESGSGGSATTLQWTGINNAGGTLDFGSPDYTVEVTW